jgi:hypothetical protein
MTRDPYRTLPQPPLEGPDPVSPATPLDWLVFAVIAILVWGFFR